ncbi:MAG: 30S ribosomal protein S3ae [Candidatus Bathyarchaeia archaeon]
MSKGIKKIKDKWRVKNWYTVYTPPYFGELNIASIPSADPKNLIGRVLETTLYDITGDFSHQSIKLYFLIVDVKGDRAETIMKGHEYSTDFLRSLVKRGSSRIDGIFNITTKDRYVTRASIVAFSQERIKSSQESAIRKIMRSVIEEKAKNLNYGQICQEMVLGKIGSDVYNLAKKITPLRHVGVRKSKLLSYPALSFKIEKEIVMATNQEKD